MLKIARKIFNWKNFTGLYKKPLVILFLFTILFSTLIPLATQAISILDTDWAPPLQSDSNVGLNRLGNTGAALMYGLSLTIDEISYVVIKYGDSLLQFGLSDPMKLSYTNPTTNPIIKAGWTLLRDLTNMLFILGLAYIGLATALNFSTFNTQKTFVRLLLVALLINFTPIICGVIVDFTNIIWNFLAKGIVQQTPNYGQASPIGQALYNAWDQMGADRFYLFNLGPDKIEKLITVWMAVMIRFFGGIALALFGILFITRHIAIWLMVIFSPLAFFAWSFDKYRKYFDMWWSQFLSWSFVAIPAMFILYLGYQLVVVIQSLT